MRAVIFAALSTGYKGGELGVQLQDRDGHCVYRGRAPVAEQIWRAANEVFASSTRERFRA